METSTTRLSHDPGPSSVPLDPLLRAPEVERLTGLRKSARAERIKAGDFPRPVLIGGRHVAWKSSEIAAWIASRPRAEAA